MESSTTGQIRAAGHADCAAVLGCLAAAFAPYQSEYTSEAYADTVLTSETLQARLGHMHVLVATVNGSIVGTISAAMTQHEGHLRGMAVLPEFHGTGIAAGLLDAIETWLRSCGCARVTLDTTLPLTAAMRFYEKHGYRRSGKTTDFFGMPLIEYIKDL